MFLASKIMTQELTLLLEPQRGGAAAFMVLKESASSPDVLGQYDHDAGAGAPA
jgi:hypothetical protein